MFCVNRPCLFGYSLSQTSKMTPFWQKNRKLFDHPGFVQVIVTGSDICGNNGRPYLPFSARIGIVLSKVLTVSRSTPGFVRNLKPAYTQKEAAGCLSPLTGAHARLVTAYSWRETCNSCGVDARGVLSVKYSSVSNDGKALDLHRESACMDPPHHIRTVNIDSSLRA